MSERNPVRSRAKVKQRQMLRLFRGADVLTVDPGFLVEERTVFGIHGEDDDLAVSVVWSDQEGCRWVADFTEAGLAKAKCSRGRVRIVDSLGDSVSLTAYRCKRFA